MNDRLRQVAKGKFDTFWYQLRRRFGSYRVWQVGKDIRFGGKIGNDYNVIKIASGKNIFGIYTFPVIGHEKSLLDITDLLYFFYDNYQGSRAELPIAVVDLFENPADSYSADTDTALFRNGRKSVKVAILSERSLAQLLVLIDKEGKAFENNDQP